ncbi:hypothetical protein C7974DRAFT_302775 [Boeremia exigua]|uniref:uncharacterized protein n=1 Tax=Boeremia exigua TaxID=749465 RepID=UPI001E8DAE5D|nr:uncharacterized protein C7974DRAFT_302775 [Boeremia exigua]KAH6642297.1 hypothetical protein C7974DRAFT_302775 [Boeremia exigua]
MSLTTSLLEPPCPKTKSSIIDAFWKPSSIPGPLVNPNISDVYWKFYHKECERALHDGGRHVLARTHQDLVDIATLIHEQQSREHIRQKLRQKLTRTHDNEDELVNRAIDLTATLLLMVDCTNVEYGFSGNQQLEWKTDSLTQCLETYFGTKPELGHEGVKLPRIFNVGNLDRIAGIEIVPTANLLDHLRLVDDDTQLYVFHHAAFLKRQANSALLPTGLVEETQRTLALLFPQSDPMVRKWHRQLSAESCVDDQLMFCGHLKTDDRQIEKFVFWHDRLVVLKQVFDEATPRNLSQWWYDRRNGVQWYTFWVAIVVLTLTLLFGFIQSVEGALQVYASFKGDK